MFGNIMALSMNENIDEEAFLRLSKQMADNKIKLIEKATECMEQLDTEEERLSYAVNVMPILCMF